MATDRIAETEKGWVVSSKFGQVIDMLKKGINPVTANPDPDEDLIVKYQGLT